MAGVPGQRSGGANRLSRSLHALRGTRPSGRLTTSPPPPPPAAPAAVPPTPKGLSVASRALWRQFHEQYELASAPALELLESALRSRDVAEQARAVLERDGLVFADGTGKPRAHPAAAIGRDARAAYVSTLRVLGFPDGEAD